MKKKNLVIFAAAYTAVLTISAFKGQKIIDERNKVMAYTQDELKDAMHKTVIEKENEELTYIYLIFEDKVKDEFWEDNYKYLLENNTLNGLKKLDFDIIEDKKEDDYIYNSEKNIAGYYDVMDNYIIVLDDGPVYANSCHEWMHFLSGGGYKGRRLANFNEAVTELMARAYCNILIDNHTIYTNYFDFTIPLIRLLGPDFVRKTYFTQDGKSIIDELNKYTNKTDKLFESYNYLCEHNKEYTKSLSDKEPDLALRKEYMKNLKEYWIIMDEIYFAKNYKMISKDNSFNNYKYRTGLTDTKYYEMSNSYVYLSKYNPFIDDYHTLISNGLRYDVDEEGITHEIELNIEPIVVK